MSAAIYGALQWCELTPEEITGVIEKIKNENHYKGEDFYNEVEKLGLYVHFDEDAQRYDWACTYELV